MDGERNRRGGEGDEEERRRNRKAEQPGESVNAQATGMPGGPSSEAQSGQPAEGRGLYTAALLIILSGRGGKQSYRGLEGQEVPPGSPPSTEEQVLLGLNRTGESRRAAGGIMMKRATGVDERKGEHEGWSMIRQVTCSRRMLPLIGRQSAPAADQADPCHEHQQRTPPHPTCCTKESHSGHSHSLIGAT